MKLLEMKRVQTTNLTTELFLVQMTVGIPNAYYYGQDRQHNFLCIDLLGPSLEDMFNLCGRRFSVKTVCMAAKQMVGVLIIFF